MAGRGFTTSWRAAALIGQCAVLALSTAACATAAASGGSADAVGDWPTLGHDPGGSRFSRLTQINRSNVAQLREAWVYNMRRPTDRPAAGGGPFGEGGGPPSGAPAGPAGAPPEAGGAQPGAPVPGGGGGNQRTQGGYSASESIPLVVDGVIYMATPYGRIVALDFANRRELWSFDVPNRDQPSTRGVEYYKGDGSSPPAILFGTRSGKLYSLNAATGQPNLGFGENGVLNLKTREVMVTGMERGYTLPSPPFVYRNLIITGSGTGEGIGGPVGDVRAWDARTGKLVWTFRSRPQKGEPGYGTWGGDSDVNRSGVNVWGLMTVDEARGIVYMPFGAPANDRIGVDRPGNNLFSSSIVAADANTGKYLWHFQITHHDIWDIDAAAPPTLVDVKRNGRTIPAVALTNKTGLLFILNRVSGEPIFGVEERPVPPSDVPGEQASATQPFPLKPEPLAQQTITRDQLAKVTPEHEAFCRKLVGDNNMLLGGPYLPTAFNRPTVNFPGTLGGVNWAGGAFDPVSGYYIVNVLNFAQIQTIIATPGQGIGFANRGQVNGRFWQQETRLPCGEPPWGQLVAVDVSTGEIAWRSTLGVSDNLPAGRQNTGRPSLGGPISTAGGLTFIAATDDGRFRAFETKTGREVWTVKLPGSAHTVPITFADKAGKQYVAITATGGAGFLGTPVTGDSVIFYALP
jgi:quinoprotein glucose dehydrogenase